MKRDRFLRFLAVIAVTGAAFVLSGLIPSCDAHVEEERARAPAHRAFVAALESAPETRRAADAAVAAAAAAEARERARNAQPLLPPAANTFVREASIRATQRQFLSMPERWPAGMAEQVKELERHYDDLKWQWRESLIEAPDTQATAQAHEKAMQARFALDKRCTDLTLLTPEARKEWDEWEAKNWQGWTPQLHDLERLKRLRMDAFVSIAGLRIDPVLEQREYLDDLADGETGVWPNEDALTFRRAVVLENRARIDQEMAEAAGNEAALRKSESEAEVESLQVR